jgi:HAE1 family hydrophobic/amphiphilic exporter-1
VTITVCTSTLAAISLTPVLASKLLRLRPKKEHIAKFGYDSTIGKGLDKLDGFYEKSIRWALVHKKVVLLLASLVFIGSIILAVKFVKTDFMPLTDESRLSVAIELQTGLRVEETAKIARRIEAIMKERYPEVTIISSSSGADDEGSFFSLFSTTGSNRINIMARLKDLSQRSRSVFEIADDLRSQLDQIAEIVNFNVSTSGGGMGGSDNTVDIEIYGYDFDMTNKLASEIKLRMEQLKGAKDILVSREEDKPELQVVLDREKLALNGLNSALVSTSIHNRVSGLIASQFREEGDEYDIILRLKENYRNSITDLEEITIITPLGNKIKLKELGQVKEYWSPPNIEHKRRQRIVRVSVKPVGVSLGVLADQIKAELKSVDIPPEIYVNVGGAFEDLQEGFLDILMLLVLSLILVFIVMASQFESFAMPFVIMFSIPFAFTGVILALLLTGTTLSLIAALGAVLLIGIVVKNGIVLVDYINLMRDRGYNLYEAVAISGHSRLRPVLMTALTTILGMMPLALSTGEGSEIWTPMGITVIGGLVFSTIVTMIIVPVMYVIFARRGERDKKQQVRKRFVFMDR